MIHQHHSLHCLFCFPTCFPSLNQHRRNRESFPHAHLLSGKSWEWYWFFSTFLRYSREDTWKFSFKFSVYMQSLLWILRNCVAQWNFQLKTSSLRRFYCDVLKLCGRLFVVTCFAWQPSFYWLPCDVERVNLERQRALYELGLWTLTIRFFSLFRSRVAGR